MKSLLAKLQIQETNPGACSGMDNWIIDAKGKELVSYNPSTGLPIASIIQATPETYEKVVAEAQRSFLTWRELPAPKHGQVVRDLGAAEKKKQLLWAEWLR